VVGVVVLIIMVMTEPAVTADVVVVGLLVDGWEGMSGVFGTTMVLLDDPTMVNELIAISVVALEALVAIVVPITASGVLDALELLFCAVSSSRYMILMPITCSRPPWEPIIGSYSVRLYEAMIPNLSPAE
jgi:hypothetical protein